jgi:exonuclease SbcC
MRLHRLEISAFGPYPGSERIDFDALSTDGLFLLHGDTGAGKTTLLDAVAFALFGAVPGARGEVKRLRCDTASPQTPTEVSLELTVAGYRFVVRRSPEYARPKKRGAGTTTQPAKGSLTWLATPLETTPEPLARLDEIGRTTQRLLGMSAEQFFQVVLLPQGEFARFLRAETGEREQLLEKLFGTQRFADVETWFSERRRADRAGLATQRGELSELVARLSQEIGEEVPEKADAEWLAALRAQRARAAEQAGEREAAAGAAARRADAALTDARAHAERLRRRRVAEAEIVALDQQAGELGASRAELDAARRAVPVLPAERRVGEQQRHAEEAAAAVAVAVQALSGRMPSVPDGIEPARAAAGQHRERAGELAALVDEERQQATDRTRLTELGEQASAARQQAAVLTERLAELPARLAELGEQHEQAVAAAARVESLRAEADTLAGDLATARALPEARAGRDRVRQANQQAVDQHQLARDRLQHLRERRLQGMAAELAGTLSPESPCPVCGAVEHPEPAAVGGDAVTDEQERAAADEEQQAVAHRQARAEELARRETELRGLAERLAGRTEEELAAHHEEVAARHSEQSALAEQQSALAEQLRATQASIEELRGQLAEQERSAGIAESEAATLASMVSSRDARLGAARGDYDGVAARRSALLATAADLDQLAGTRGEAQGQQRLLEDYVRAREKESAEAGFADVASALAAARDTAATEVLRERLEEADRRRAAALAVLAEPELAELPDVPEPDLAALSEAMEAAHAEERAASGQATGERERLDRIEGLARRLEEGWRRLAPVEAAFAELDALTDVVNGHGQNAKRMSLRSYVLAARLEEVALAATRRLRAMSGGRYSFVHSDSAGPRGTRGGLGLDVLDDYSGQTRSAKTLSGGESFLASLALALGLADVVAAETGGAVLDTLFVDEGFGSLDPDTLEEVMATLDELRAGGRVVGLVSHVDELRQRIPTRLRVEKARTGSTLEMVTE